MRLFVFIAALLMSTASSISVIAQERPYEAPPTPEVTDQPVHVPVYRAPAYDSDAHLLVYVVYSLGMPEADLPFTLTPGGVVIPRTDLSAFRALVLAEEGRMLFVCTVREAARATFDFAKRASRDAFCVLN